MGANESTNTNGVVYDDFVVVREGEGGDDGQELTPGDISRN